MMKAAALLSLALGAAASPLVQSQDARAAEGHIVVAGGVAPASQDLTPRYADYAPGSKRTKVRYGKYNMPSVKAVTPMSVISGEQGTSTGISMMLAKPCSGSCSLIVAQAGLEYPNGTVADLSGGAWLHHIVMLNGGPGRVDSTCAIFPGERFFSSGNERTPTSFGDVTSKRIKTAYPLKATDAFFMQYELMNMIDTPQDVYITIDFEYIPGALPAGWKNTKAMWFDVTGCPGISSVIPPAGKKQFTLNMTPWTSPYSGTMLGVGGHLHDGGVTVNTYKNNKVICKSDANYSGKDIPNTDYATGSPVASPSSLNALAGGSSASNSMAGMAGMAMKRTDAHGPDMDSTPGAHITQMTTCTNMGAINKGDVFKIDASYDFASHEGMKSTTGSYTEVMGIAIMYAAINV